MNQRFSLFLSENIRYVLAIIFFILFIPILIYTNHEQEIYREELSKTVTQLQFSQIEKIEIVKSSSPLLFKYIMDKDSIDLFKKETCSMKSNKGGRRISGQMYYITYCIKNASKIELTVYVDEDSVLVTLPESKKQISHPNDAMISYELRKYFYF